MDAREVVARAIWPLVNFTGPTPSKLAEHYYDKADAILAALAANQLAVVGREPTEAMIDAPRPLFLFYGPRNEKWTLGQHIDAGTHKIKLTDDERGLTYLTKAHLALLAWRAMFDAISPSPVSTGDRR